MDVACTESCSASRTWRRSVQIFISSTNIVASTPFRMAALARLICRSRLASSTSRSGRVLTVSADRRWVSASYSARKAATTSSRSISVDNPVRTRASSSSWRIVIRLSHQVGPFLAAPWQPNRLLPDLA
ncbi:hypothetical protein ASE90_18825 [Sphingomonas sp. Leaf67]|nr:hypothetical protein ASE90_18825 [Sphingomonas sp. Leaf67]